MTNLATGAPAWWGRSDQDAPTAPVLVLDPTAPQTGAGDPHSGTADWLEWGSHMVLFQAGCYRLTATWAAGSWSMTVAAGR